ncbi:SCO family protein [Reichenbachiella versicolor]|uniref:SCO family protein n=1 Tax=Reichenbachiella versicolor TaxID=1821036 RepID=UPI000D6DDAE0|nr:SCO family protein [Reichenbachiella versicolor]
MKQLLFFSILVFLWSCTKQEKRETITTVIDLPYYSDAQLNAVWYDDNDPLLDKLHRITDFSFYNQDGKIVTNETVEGKIYVTNFFFSICPNVCPKMTKNLHRVQNEFITNDRVMILSHTVMPWVDSVGRLNEYAKLNDINSSRWHLLTGKKEDIYSIARTSYFADEGFGKSITSNEDFLHTESIILIDQNRHIRGVYNGTIPLDISRLIDDIHYLLEKST